LKKKGQDRLSHLHQCDLSSKNTIQSLEMFSHHHSYPHLGQELLQNSKPHLFFNIANGLGKKSTLRHFSLFDYLINL
jgi:hypothetical protein